MIMVKMKDKTFALIHQKQFLVEFLSVKIPSQTGILLLKYPI